MTQGYEIRSKNPRVRETTSSRSSAGSISQGGSLLNAPWVRSAGGLVTSPVSPACPSVPTRSDLVTARSNLLGQHLYEKLGYVKAMEDFSTYLFVL